MTILFTWIAWSCCGNAEAQWVNPPSAAQRSQMPGLVHATFHSESMQTKVGYSVVLPPSYHSSDRRYPVVYWLHGGGGNECSSLFTAQPWTDLYRNRRIDEVILVYPAAFRSGYMDHSDGKTMVESMIIKELIPRIDAEYRTVASREGRAAHGFSMGASGALKFAIRYPHLFCSAVAYGGGAVDLENDHTPFIRNILERNLSSDPDLIRQNNTYFHLSQNAAEVRQRKTSFLLICGAEDTWKDSAETFHAELLDRGIGCELILVPGVGHQIRELSQAEGSRAAEFQDQAFSRD